MPNIDAPGTDDAAYIAFRLVDRLLDLLVTKGIITEAETMTLLDELTRDMSEDRRSVAQSSAIHMRDAIRRKHQPR